MFLNNPFKSTLVSAEDALPGRDQPIPVIHAHYVTGQSIQPPFAKDLQQAFFAMGCFGGLSVVFGSSKVCFQRQLVTLVVIRQIQPMKKSAQALPVTPRWY